MLYRAAFLLCLSLTGWSARAQSVLDPALLERVRQLAETAARATAPPETRVAVEIGALDARLRLAPCRQVQPYLPTGMSAWGRSRIGLRCTDGVARWNVTLPVRVSVFGRVVVAATPLPAGVNLSQEHLAMADIDIAAEPGAVFTDASALLGRTLGRPLAAADAVRAPALKSRQWFAAGETVQVRAAGSGFAIVAEAQALGPGLEGQDVKVRFESGRVASGRAVGERRVELLL
ncbi:flagellar basal body P-ring formation chaperone FlgA [Roseateles asaccharophilus]|uniref:Flagella basal body P-ring formation protein FlgA n=1 Tax=Roseateles asaccharophilus TaxID=582607 RepID=A0ABU2ACV5_9BURK|nr:flagellar basal body P-ring formation chaperone FlgA [Roseateles asaccharophilus]MDR7335033.1 flagella basal body P-ring formation protein FlgA [Roseateles asaccharophilus]